MAPIEQKTNLPNAVRQRLREIWCYFSAPHVGRRIAEGVLSDREIEQLGDDESLQGKVQVYAQSRGRSLERALLDIALDASVIAVGEHRRLRRRIGEPVEGPDDQPRPHWDRATGVLSYEGRSIREVAGQATNVRRILAAFEESRWSRHVDNPLPGGENSKKLRDALANLNQSGVPIRFRADGRAAGVLWEEA